MDPYARFYGQTEALRLHLTRDIAVCVFTKRSVVKMQAL
jgi:hypothetical protein